MAYIRCGQTATASENKWFYQGLKMDESFARIQKKVYLWHDEYHPRVPGVYYNSLN